ncbi:DUF6503 family protein [Aquimarina sp. MMG016]|uniref:DUF6503 family protein n=1 Tax=Aquimarina sp. MMG016 TaxID=2822690 RepID=UPI001B39F2F1|nr:DUF6503 family protein [Aquimarina sp. MMG016]MBQ4822005.1 hypothetical protein [Aquimarina sp. MMG016]
MYFICLGKKYGIIFLMVLIGWLTSCQQTETDPSDIIIQSLEAHRGIENWEKVKEISYLKTTILYDSLGNIEKKLVQKHKNIFKPEFSAAMEWEEDSMTKKVILKKGKISLFHNDSLQTDAKLKKQSYKSIIAANYVFWQPYKLLDKTAKLTYIGKEEIDNKPVYVIQAKYNNEDGSPANTWWYYFDTKTNKLVGNMVHHSPTYSFIKNIKYENQTGLFLNAERKSYRTDSLRNIKFLRAEYSYKVLNFK